MGKGFGGPVVTAGAVYLLDRDDKVGDTLRCLDLSTGKDLWQFAYDAPGTAMFPGSRSVPAVEGHHISENDPLASRVGGHTQNWAPLALADGKLLVRDQSKLKCVQVAP